MRRTAVLDVVGLTPALLGDATPRLCTWAGQGRVIPVAPVLPAVTCSVQATYLTGSYPDSHGIVGNGWYDRDECEVRFWRQSNRLVRSEKIWDKARRIHPSFTCANLFWWYNMYSGVDYAVTPRPCYPADGRKIPDIYTQPASLRDELQLDLGRFPLFDFWGPRASIRSSEWISAAAKRVEERFSPTLNLIYLPHLDYNLQRLGPSDPAIKPDLRAIDALCGDLIDYYEAREVQVIVVSEYGISDVVQPVHLNRLLRAQGLLTVREELGRELLDAGASKAFALADHQIAHVYINDRASYRRVRSLLENTKGVERVLDTADKKAAHLDHARAGDLIAIAERHAWFTYYYWWDDARSPDFARTVDIHRKPGYDPAELFIDPTLLLPKIRIAWKLGKKALGFRTLLDVIPLDASVVKGSHGRPSEHAAEGALFMTKQQLARDALAPTEVQDAILRHCFDEEESRAVQRAARKSGA